MFDVGFWELALLGVIALVFIGPERLPAAARTAGQWVGQARRILRDAKADLDRELRADAAGLGDLQRGIEEAGAELQSAGAQSGDALRRTFQEASPLAQAEKSAPQKRASKKKAKKKASKKKVSKKRAAKKKGAKKAAKKKPAKKKASKRRAPKNPRA